MFPKRKRWRYVFLLIFCVFTSCSIPSFSNASQEADRVREAAERVIISQLSVCTIDGKSVTKQEDSSLYIVPKGMEKIYICGSLQTPVDFIITIYLYKSGAGKAFHVDTSGKFMPTGLFTIYLISTEALKGGEYHADLFIMKEVRGTVRFLVEK